MKPAFHIHSEPISLRHPVREPFLRSIAAVLIAGGLSVTGTAAWAATTDPTTPATGGTTTTTPATGGTTSGTTSPTNSGPNGQISFTMVRSAAIVKAACVPDAAADVTVKSRGPVEEMTVSVKGLPPSTDFDFFVIQVPNAPFGLAWYQGDIETDIYGTAQQTFVGRFNEETFIVAPGSANAPVVHHGQFPDASSNPQTAPIHTYHVGLWFNSPDDAAKAGCPNTTTPFNGEHNAGPQVLNTSQFADTQGPLFGLKP